MVVVMPNGFAGAAGGPAGFLAGAIFRRLDADKDGKVTEDELVTAARQFFKECDKDNKGALDEKQLAEGLTRSILTAGPGRAGGFRGPGRSSAFEDDLLKDVIPYVEAHYAVQSGREHRALAGLSMGGGQALTIGLSHLDHFAWVGGFSSALFGAQADLIRDPGLASKQLR